MGDAGIEDLMRDVEGNLQKVQEKFRLELDDQEAMTFICGIVDTSVSMIMPNILEWFHKMATKRK